MEAEEVLGFAQGMVAKGLRVALVTVTETWGSSPASPGQMMAVGADGESRGTVGGGATEHRLIRRSMGAIKADETIYGFSFDHGENGMVCGGGMKGFGHVLGAENPLYIFGGGHVGQRLAQLAALSGFDVTVVEDRPEYQAQVPWAHFCLCTPEDYRARLPLPRGAFCVICTRGHRSDDQALRFCLGQDCRYIGMIGSRQKVEALFRRLRQEGYEEAKLRAVYSPIGLDIASRIPAEIAVSILAEILLVKNGGSPAHKGRPKD